VKSSILIPFIPNVGEVLLTIFVTFLLSFLMFSLLFYVASKRLKLHFNFAEFLVYFLFYQPLSSLILFIGIITAFFSGKHEMDWKV
jgi:hypothetical protein